MACGAGGTFVVVGSISPCHPDDNHVSVGPADAATSLWLGTTPQPVRVHVQYAHQGNQL